MTENEVIVVNCIPEQHYNALIEQCVKYAIISLPFTVDRMRVVDEKKRALNIAKGKVAESLFQYFCNHNGINPDFETCTTPFWTVDRRDFLLGNNEWDIKNNFLYHSNTTINNYTLLPALVPNRFQGDQWSHRNEHSFQNTAQVKFLFTFLKNADLTNGNRGLEFLDIILTPAQEQFIREQYQTFQGLPQERQPFTEDWFWDQMRQRGTQALYTLRSRPNLVITSYADSATFNLFRDTGGRYAALNYQNYIAPRWYNRYDSGSVNFLNGTLWTVIQNATCPVAELPSFYSLFPHLQNGMVGAVRS